jgi:hypothetical protein
MARDAAEKGMSTADLGIMLTEVKEGAPDKRGRWIIFKGFLRDEWYQGRRQYPFIFKARPETPWPVVATPQANPKRRNVATSGGRRARRRPRRAGVRRNPRSEKERAAAQFQKWQDRPDARGRWSRMKGPERVPKHMAALGSLVEVVYESNKYDGKKKLYKHRTKRPRPVLATDPDGRHVFVVGGNMKVTADGLVN